MIIATSKSDTMLRRGLGKNQTSITTLERMCEQFSLDPAISNPVRDAYVVTNEDISSTKTKTLFEQSLATKHPASKILFINKSSKPIYQNGMDGIDAIIQKPKPQDIMQAISAIMSGKSITEVIDPGVDKNPMIPGMPSQTEQNVQPDWVTNPRRDANGNPIMPISVDAHGNPIYAEDQAQPVQQEVVTVEVVRTDENGIMYDAEGSVITPHHADANGVWYTIDNYTIVTKEVAQPEVLEVPEPQPVVVKPVVEVEDPESLIISRINNASKVCDISVLAREVTASELIKDLIQTNSTYQGIEEKLRSLNEIIYQVLGDSTIPSLDVKLSKIRAVLHDKAFFGAKDDTIIVQRLEEVIDTICNKTAVCLKDRLDELDVAIKSAYARLENHDELDSPRMAGLGQERTNIIMELRLLESEIMNIYKSCDGLIVGTVAEMSRRTDDMTGNPMINEQLKARGSHIVSQDTVLAARTALEISSDKLPEVFNKMRLDIITMIKLMSKLLDLDSEIIIAQQAYIQFLKSKNVEESVIAKSILKKSLRVYVGTEGSGTTIIPYLISHYRSRTSANVLCLDLTGYAKYEDYGILYTKLDDYLSVGSERQFQVVAGTVENTVEAGQRIVSALWQAADYYRAINIIVNPEQRELLATISADVLSINYIVDTSNKNLSTMKKVIEDTNFENVGRRLIINKCDVPVKPIINKLGLMDSIEYQICVIPTNNAITDAGLSGYNPYGISAIDLLMEDVLRHA